MAVNHPSGSSESQELFPARIVFDPKAEGIEIQPGEKVFLSCYYIEGISAPMREEDGQYVWEGELPDNAEYSFFNESGQSLSTVHTFRMNSQQESDEAEGAADQQTDEKNKNAVHSLRESVYKSVSESFCESSQREMKDKPEAGRAIYRRIRQAVDRLVEQSGRNPEVVRYLKHELECDVIELQNVWVRARFKSKTAIRDFLGVPEGRAEFRAEVFNTLCSKGKLGLNIRKQIEISDEEITEEELEAKMRKALGRKYDVFDRICSSYDGGSVARAWRSVATGIAENIGEDQPELAEEAGALKMERSKLMGKVMKSAARELESGHSVRVAEYGTFEKVLEAGGDIALKTAAIFLLASGHYYLAPLLWSARGLTKAAGFEFGNVLKEIVKAPVKIPAKILQAGAGLLPASVKEKLPEAMRDWIEESSMPSFRKTQRARLPWTGWARTKIFLRHLFPMPDLLEKIPKVNEIVPDEPVNTGKEVARTALEDSKEVKSACEEFLSTFK